MPLSREDSHIHTTRLFAGVRLVGVCTLLSRVLGLVRDVGMAALFGGGVVMDAFSVAFRVPNLARRLFGEGALTAAFLPVFVRELRDDSRETAWRVASAIFGYLALALVVLVVVLELLLWAVATWGSASAETNLLIALTAVLLPYLIAICLAAQVSAVLHALGHFAWPALLPVLLNVVWIAGIWAVAPQFETAPTQACAVAWCVVAAGVLQIAAPLPMLFRLGFRWQGAWKSVHRQVGQILRSMLPIVVGLSVTQLNAVADSLMAWGFARPEGGPATMPLPGSPVYPLEIGTASALYFGQRMYQFPLGVFGIALGTVLFPQLSRHAAVGRLDRLRDDLTLGLRLVLSIGVPASVGLVLLAEPLTLVLFRHGAFDAHDARQTAGMIVAYGVAVWAFCGQLIVNRGYYAVGDQQTPLRLGLAMVVLNLVLNATLIWFLGGPGLAWATSICAIVYVIGVVWLIQRRIGRLDWKGLWETLLRVSTATIVMAAVCGGVLAMLPADNGIWSRVLRVVVPVAASVAVYLAGAKALGMHEVWLLLGRGTRTSLNDETES